MKHFLYCTMEAQSSIKESVDTVPTHMKCWSYRLMNENDNHYLFIVKYTYYCVQKLFLPQFSIWKNKLSVLEKNSLGNFDIFILLSFWYLQRNSSHFDGRVWRTNSPSGISVKSSKPDIPFFIRHFVSTLQTSRPAPTSFFRA